MIPPEDLSVKHVSRSKQFEKNIKQGMNLYRNNRFKNEVNYFVEIQILYLDYYINFMCLRYSLKIFNAHNTPYVSKVEVYLFITLIEVEMQMLKMVLDRCGI